MNSHKYDDIIQLPHPTSKKHPRMPLYDRAAQFAPFAALTGHDMAVRETERLTDERMELSGEMIDRLNHQLSIIRERLGTGDEVFITYFVPDDRKTGGKYVTCAGVVKRIDDYGHVLTMQDGSMIPLEQIVEIHGDMFREIYE